MRKQRNRQKNGDKRKGRNKIFFWRTRKVGKKFFFG